MPRGWNVNKTAFFSPGASSTRAKPFNSHTAVDFRSGIVHVELDDFRAGPLAGIRDVGSHFHAAFSRSREP
jgi:hypothetical protein